jgi:hypothetical protein
VRVAPVAATPEELELAIRQAGYSPAAQDKAPRRAAGCGCGSASARSVDMAQVRTSAPAGCCGGSGAAARSAPACKA